MKNPLPHERLAHERLAHERLSHENEYGYRYCIHCRAWKPRKEFAVSILCHDRYHPLCLLHVDQAESDWRTGRAAVMLSKAGVHPSSKLTSNG